MRRAVLAALVLLTACSRTPPPGRVMVLGFDGMDPQTVDLMLAEGKLPHFARLRQDGAYGRLQSSPPLLSPVVWTTIATGKTPDQHGIGHFVAVSPTGESLPVTSRMRKVKALWNVLSDSGRSVSVVGWWATWPAETVKGTVVSDHTCYHFLFPQGEGGAATDGITHPPELFARISPLVRRPADVTPQEAARFISVGPEELARPFDFKDDVSHFKWALATADTYRRIGLQRWREDRPQVLFAYVEATDSVAHLFGHLFRAGELSGELARQQARFGRAVEEMYGYADEILGQYLEAMDGDTTLVVLSDHGFALGALPDDPSTTRDMRRVSERFHREQGILYLYGRGVKRGRVDGARLLDVAPTVLALAGLPSAADMPGRVLGDALSLDPPGPKVASYETSGAAATAAPAADAKVDPAILERLKSLGYVGGAPPPPSVPRDGQARSPEGERNLAAMLFESGRHQEAADAYARLVKESPKDSALRTSLAGALGALGRYQEALAQLEVATKLDPLNVEAYQNRGAALERLGRKAEAIQQYRTAVRYRPQYEPSRQALVRLTGSADVNAPRTDAERRAFRLAEEAAAAARRGDYAGAGQHLTEAERIAPRYVLVHQYRSNVAYLSGDRAGAIRALEKALALEPDNALFKSNLARLREAPTRQP